MLNVQPIRAGAERYYFSTVRATTDLPDGLIERDPVWLGRGAADLGLHGEPTIQQVRQLFAGVDPVGGRDLAPSGPSKRTIAAFDIVMSTPKSVSILHALASPEAGERIEAAHDAAVAATLRFIEDEVLGSKKSTGSGPDRVHEFVPSNGAVSVAFLHRTSRANDPHLHTHVVLANASCGWDGVWRGLDGLRLYGSVRVVKALFESHLRSELTAVGMRFGPMRRDFADVVGFDATTIRLFSRQSEQIKAAMALAGVEGRQAAAAIAATVRPEKDRSRPWEELQDEWRDVAHSCGLSQSRLDRAAGLEPAMHRGWVSLDVAGTGRTGREGAGVGDSLDWVQSAASRGDGTFTRHDLLVARCSSLSPGMSVEAAIRSVDEALARPEVLGVGPTGDRYTTAAQQELLREAAARLGSLARETGARVLAYDGAGGVGRVGALEAAALLAWAVGGGGTGGPRVLGAPIAGAAVVDAPPGRVVGLAPGVAAAARFEASTGIESFPVKQGSDVVRALGLGSGDFVVLADCASMLEAELADVMSACRSAGATPVLFSSERALESAGALDVVAAEAPRVAPLERWRPEPALPEVPALPALPDVPALTPRQLGPNVSVELAPDVASGCAAAIQHALRLQAEGRDPVLVLPDASLVKHVEEVLGRARPATPESPADPPVAGSLTVLQARQLSAHLAARSSTRDGAARPPALVVLGGAAPLAMNATRLATVERTHVVVTGGAHEERALARAAEVVRPPHLVAELGPVRREPEARELWRAGAVLLESHRDVHGITAEPSSFGREGDMEERLLRRRVQEIRSELRAIGAGRDLGQERELDRAVPGPAPRPVREIGGRGLSM